MLRFSEAIGNVNTKMKRQTVILLIMFRLVEVYKSVCSGPAVQGELCLGPGEERLRHRRGHLLVQVGGQLCQQTLAKGCQ